VVFHYKYTFPAIALVGLAFSFVFSEDSWIDQKSTAYTWGNESVEAGNKLEKLCKKLELPLNEDADIALLELINEWLGTAYCYGGNSKSCIDCSGFTNQVYTTLYNKTIPRVSSEIHAKSMPIKKYALYQGDLVFFATSGGSRVSHVGVYLWDGYFVHASSSRGVIISNLRQGYYNKTFVSGGAWIDE
jgi:hypothetical protein